MASEQREFKKYRPGDYVPGMGKLEENFARYDASNEEYYSNGPMGKWRTLGKTLAVIAVGGWLAMCITNQSSKQYEELTTPLESRLETHYDKFHTQKNYNLRQ